MRAAGKGVFFGMAGVALALSLAFSAQAEETTWRSGLSTIGEVKYPDGFAHFDYVNPEAPKGGELKLSETGTFDTFNPLLAKGEAATGVSSLVFDTLL